MANRISLEQIEGALEKFNIPPRPDILSDIQAEMQSCEPDIKRLAGLIEHDRGLSHFTLKVVNSPLFSLRRKVTSIEHACNFLGMQRIIKLVQSILLRATLSGENESNFERRVWGTAGNVAMGMAILAKGLEFNDEFCEDCFVVGQFHNAGMAMAYKLLPDYERTVRAAYQQSKFTIAEYEEHEIFCSHEVLGYLIANKWGLADIIVEVITYHHNHELMLNSGIQTEEQMFALLKLAEHMTAMPKTLVNVDQDLEWERYGTDVLKVLNLEHNHLTLLGKKLNQAGINCIY